jgi:hypothetical protein
MKFISLIYDKLIVYDMTLFLFFLCFAFEEEYSYISFTYDNEEMKVIRKCISSAFSISIPSKAHYMLFGIILSPTMKKHLDILEFSRSAPFTKKKIIICNFLEMNLTNAERKLTKSIDFEIIWRNQKR